MEMGTAHHFGWVPSGTHPPFYNNPCIKCKARWVPRPLANLDPRGRLLDPPGRLLEPRDRFLKPRGRLLAPVGALLAPVGTLFVSVGSLLDTFLAPRVSFWKSSGSFCGPLWYQYDDLGATRLTIKPTGVQRA